MKQTNKQYVSTVDNRKCSQDQLPTGACKKYIFFAFGVSPACLSIKIKKNKKKSAEFCACCLSTPEISANSCKKNASRAKRCTETSGLADYLMVVSVVGVTTWCMRAGLSVYFDCYLGTYTNSKVVVAFLTRFTGLFCPVLVLCTGV